MQLTYWKFCECSTALHSGEHCVKILSTYVLRHVLLDTQQLKTNKREQRTARSLQRCVLPTPAGRGREQFCPREALLGESLPSAAPPSCLLSLLWSVNKTEKKKKKKKKKNAPKHALRNSDMVRITAISQGSVFFLVCYNRQHDYSHKTKTSRG